MDEREKLERRRGGVSAPPLGAERPKVCARSRPSSCRGSRTRDRIAAARTSAVLAGAVPGVSSGIRPLGAARCLTYEFQQIAGTETEDLGRRCTATGITHHVQRARRRAGRLRPLAACFAAQRSISGLSQSLTRPGPRSKTGLGMSAYRRLYWLTVLRWARPRMSATPCVSSRSSVATLGVTNLAYIVRRIRPIRSLAYLPRNNS
jgi:hypothetical protein